MNRAEKETFVNSLDESVGQAQALALISFTGLDVEKMTAFRLDLRKRNVKVTVVKNSLAERVFSSSKYPGLADALQGPMLLAYSSEDPVVAAKAIYDWIGKEGFGLKIKAGAAMGKVISNDQMKVLSSLPGRNELFVSFLWGLKMPATKFLYALSDAPKQLGYALAALRTKKEKEA